MDRVNTHPPTTVKRVRPTVRNLYASSEMPVRPFKRSARVSITGTRFGMGLVHTSKHQGPCGIAERFAEDQRWQFGD